MNETRIFIPQNTCHSTPRPRHKRVNSQLPNILEGRQTTPKHLFNKTHFDIYRNFPRMFPAREKKKDKSRLPRNVPRSRTSTRSQGCSSSDTFTCRLPESRNGRSSSALRPGKEQEREIRPHLGSENPPPFSTLEELSIETATPIFFLSAMHLHTASFIFYINPEFPRLYRSFYS